MTSEIVTALKKYLMLLCILLFDLQKHSILSPSAVSQIPLQSLPGNTEAEDKGVCGFVCSYFNLSSTQAILCHKIMRWLMFSLK